MRISLVRDSATVVNYAQLGVVGYWSYGFGPVVPLLRDEQHTSRAVAGLHGSALAAAALVGGFVLPWLVRRFGRPAVSWYALAGLAAGTLGLWAARSFPATMAVTFVAGLAGGVLGNAVMASLSARHGPAAPAAISEANAVVAGVGVISPLVVGGAVAAGLGWRPGLAALVLVAAAVALVGLFSGRRPGGPAVDRSVPVVAGRSPLPLPYWLAWTSMLVTGSVEICLNLWAGDELRGHAGVSPGAAAAAVSAIVGGMFVGRLVGVRLALRLPAPVVLLGAFALSAAGFTVFWLASVGWLAVGGLLVCGLGNSLHYPLAVALAVAHSGGRPDLAAARASYAMAAGFGVAPLALGRLADGIGIHRAFLMVYVFLAVAAVVVGLLRRGRPVSAPVRS